MLSPWTISRRREIGALRVFIGVTLLAVVVCGGVLSFPATTPAEPVSPVVYHYVDLPPQRWEDESWSECSEGRTMPEPGVAGVAPDPIAEVFSAHEQQLAEDHKGAAMLAERFLRREPEGLRRDELNSFVDLAAGPRTYRQGLRALASMKHQLGPDLLYKVMRTAQVPEISSLAASLLQTPPVRGRASPSLRVAIDSFEIDGCQEAEQLLERATVHGDRRAFKFLAPLTLVGGCGEGGQDDCFSCIRGDRRVALALSAVNRRPEPF